MRLFIPYSILSSLAGILLGLLLVLDGSQLSAQKIEFKAKAPAKVSMGSRFQLVFELNTNKIRGFQPPAINDFQLVAQPEQRTQINSGFGQKASMIFTYTYNLTPVKEGTFTIGKATAQVGNKVYYTDPVTITVTKQAPGQSASKNQSKDLYIKLLVSKRDVYQGEALTATFKLYSRLAISGSNNATQPSYNGFWTEEIDVPNSGQLRTEYIDGVPYQTAVLESRVLFPQRSGNLEIDPFSLELKVRIRDNSRPRSMFDSFFNYTEKMMKVTSNASTIKVKPLPGGAPDGFDGAVGDFAFILKADKDSVAVNEGINLKIAIRGNGNLTLVKDPELEFPQEFEVYDPKVNNRVSASSEGVSGKKESEYLLIPRHAGQYQLPSLSFSFFNPKQGKYITLNSEALKIIVGKGDGEIGGGPRTFSPTVKEEIAVLGNDIRFIKPGPADLQEEDDYFIGSGGFYALLCAPCLLFLAFLPLRKHQRIRNADTVGQRMRKANRIATQRLAEAKISLDSGASAAFYDAVSKALFGFLGDKLNLPVSELNKDRIRETLNLRGVNEATTVELVSVLDRCEMARFAPVNDTTEQAIYEQAAEIIRQLEGQLK